MQAPAPSHLLGSRLLAGAQGGDHAGLGCVWGIGVYPLEPSACDSAQNTPSSRSQGTLSPRSSRPASATAACQCWRLILSMRRKFTQGLRKKLHP